MSKGAAITDKQFKQYHKTPSEPNNTDVAIDDGLKLAIGLLRQFINEERVHYNKLATNGDIETFLLPAIKALLVEAEKAYGGCHNCYGKGYATVADGIIGYDDFGGEGFKTPITAKMKFCSCERGKQLEAALRKETP